MCLRASRLCAGSAGSLAGSLTCAQGKQIGKLEGLRGQGEWILTKYCKYLLFYCRTKKMQSSGQKYLDAHKILPNSNYCQQILFMAERHKQMYITM